MQKVGDAVKSKTERNLLNSVLPGNPSWDQKHKSHEIDCLASCPMHLSGSCNGPEDVCSTGWEQATLTPDVANVIVHVLKNFNHYNAEYRELASAETVASVAAAYSKYDTTDISTRSE